MEKDDVINGTSSDSGDMEQAEIKTEKLDSQTAANEACAKAEASSGEAGPY